VRVVPVPDRSLYGPRVLLRPGTDADAPLLVALRAEPSVRRWWGRPDAADEIAARLRGERDELVFVVEVDGAVSGEAQATEEDDPDYRSAAIDVYLAAAVQGRGLGTEVVALLAAHLLDDRGHHRVTIDPAVENGRAVTAYERVGFRRVGVARAYERAEDGTWHDNLLLDLLADDLVRVPYVPVTLETCGRVRGPFFHGTAAALEVGDELVPGRTSNFAADRVMNNVYFSAVVETAVWGAELATALAGSAERGRVYVVEPLGPFEDDPNVTDKKFPGNRTQSYRSRSPLRVAGEVVDWPGHRPEVLQGMLDGLARLRAEGRDLIED
jgi:RimJ/RimL family protein N-acetyltransferase